jgi:hypothetical protein
MPQTNEQRERAAIERLLSEARTNVEFDWMPKGVNAETPYAADIIGFCACFYYGFQTCFWYGDFRVSYTQWDAEAGCDFEMFASGPTPFIAVFRLIARIEQFATPIEEPEDEG